MIVLLCVGSVHILLLAAIDIGSVVVIGGRERLETRDNSKWAGKRR